jgi:hypothetical protein
MQQIICDVCKKTINVREDQAMGLFEYYRINELMTIDAVLSKRQSNDKTLEKVKYDLCRECLEKIDSFIHKELISKS